MTWVFAILIVLAMGGVAAVAVGRGDPMADEHADHPDVLVPTDRPLTAGDLRAVRFPLVLRGYRMKDVDALLDRLAAQVGEGPEDRRPEPAVDSPAEADHPEP
jgi:DivIVA domain-containing protein